MALNFSIFLCPPEPLLQYPCVRVQAMHLRCMWFFENGPRKNCIFALFLDSQHFREREKVAETFRQRTFSFENSSSFGFWFG